MTMSEWVLLYLAVSFAMAYLIELHGRHVPAKKFLGSLIAAALWPIPAVHGFIQGAIEELKKPWRAR